MPNYTYPGTDTVKHKLGAVSHEELEQRQGRYVAARRSEIEAGYGPKGNFDADHLKAIHRHLFQDVYEWAGRTRDESILLSDGTVATEPVMRKAGGAPFLVGTRIPKALDRIAAGIRNANYLCGLDPERFAVRAADIMAAINAVHAFREGNGRTQRTFMRELAKKAGHELDCSGIM